MRPARSIAVALDRAVPVEGEDAALVSELQAGSEEAFTYLIAIHQNPVFNLICHIVQNPADAADVLQEVFVKIFRSIRYFHGESSLKTWIYKIAVHEASNHRRGWLRRLRREPVSLDAESGQRLAMVAQRQAPAEGPYELLEQAERQQQVRRALAGVPEPYKTALILREIEGLAYEEMAEVLGVPVGTVKSRLMRGRDMLRSRLGDARSEEDGVRDSGFGIRAEQFEPLTPSP